MNSRVHTNGLNKRFNISAKHDDKEKTLSCTSAHCNLTIANNVGTRVLKASGYTNLKFYLKKNIS